MKKEEEKTNSLVVNQARAIVNHFRAASLANPHLSNSHSQFIKTILIKKQNNALWRLLCVKHTHKCKGFTHDNTNHTFIK